METGPVIPIPTLPSGENPARASGQGPTFPPPPQYPPQRPTGALPTGSRDALQFPPSPAPPIGQQRPTAGKFAVPQPTGQQLKAPQGGLTSITLVTPPRKPCRPGGGIIGIEDNIYLNVLHLSGEHFQKR